MDASSLGPLEIDPMLGRTIEGRYLIRRFIGRGGMGRVYEAEHIGLDRPVAIKFLAREGRAGADLERFRREARAAGRVDHDHVVRVIDVGTTADNFDFIVMEYVDGSDLQAVLEAGPLDVTRAVTIARQLLDGLHAIHRAGIVHRDIKPGNVLLAARADGDPRAFVKLVDFGIAKSAHEVAELTASGIVLGTPQFMAPERFTDNSLDHRADIYSVGVLLYTMLAGAPPFFAATVEQLARLHIDKPPPSLAALVPGVPAALVAAITRALSKTPAERFPDAHAFATALDQVLEQTVAQAEASTVPARSGGTPATRPAMVRARAVAPEPAQPRRLDLSSLRVIDRFELIRELGRGGMGQVFLARDTKLGRRVAIKFLLYDDPSFVQRFLVEARATARCTHENIVTVFDVGEHAGLPYMVLEYLEGTTLTDVLATKPSERHIVELMVPVVRALVRAHEHSIVHRDLKPSNISVTNRGAVKVLDFGVARMMNLEENALRVSAAMTAVSPDDGLTGSNALIGTLHYMSPEQWRGAAVDHLSDIWAIGIILWRALAGTHPAGSMTAENLSFQLQNLATPFPDITTQVPAITPKLAVVVNRCLVKRKEGRYQSATELLRDLETVLATGAAHQVSDDESPYRGLAPFGEGDARFFFGRSNEIRTAVARLESWPLLAVVGPSGAGKSSFVHGGLVPALKASGGKWRVHSLRPGRLPLLRLAAVLEESLGTGESAAELTAQLRDAPGLLGSILRRTAAREGHNVLIVVDQLEELFTLCDSPSLRRNFLSALLAAADDPSSPIRVVISIRADFLDRLAGDDNMISELARGMFFLPTPDPANLRETLVRPAELAGYAFEQPWIVDDMMQAASTRGALPLLSFCASRLWDARDRHRRMLTATAYTQMGRIAGAFARHADEIAASIPPTGQRLLRATLARLVTIDGTRAIVDRRDLLSLSDDPREVERVLDTLVAGRLIHVYIDPDQVATVELVHEMLITEWPALRRWLDDSKAMRSFVEELRLVAKQWETRGKPADLVWRGATGQEALANARRHVLDLSSVEREFLDAVAQHASRQRKRRAALLASIATALGLVITGAGVAVVRIKSAESEAQDKARAASDALASEQRASDALQEKLAIIEAERSAREAAEQERVTEEAKRVEAERLAATAEGVAQLTREQLEAANVELRRMLIETRAAKDKALAAEAAAARLLAKERAERERLERERKLIDRRQLE